MVRIDARTYWNWVFQNQQVVIDVIRNSRAASVVADVLDGHRPSGRCDHDCVMLDGVASAEPSSSSWFGPTLVCRRHGTMATSSSSDDSSAAALPTSGFAPTPSPWVRCGPNWLRRSARHRVTGGKLNTP